MISLEDRHDLPRRVGNLLRDNPTPVLCLGLIVSSVTVWIDRLTGLSLDFSSWSAVLSDEPQIKQLLLALGIATVARQRIVQAVLAALLFFVSLPQSVLLVKLLWTGEVSIDFSSPFEVVAWSGTLCRFVLVGLTPGAALLWTRRRSRRPEQTIP